jgi:hypothetical protein
VQVHTVCRAVPELTTPRQRLECGHEAESAERSYRFPTLPSIEHGRINARFRGLGDGALAFELISSPSGSNLEVVE